MMCRKLMFLVLILFFSQDIVAQGKISREEYISTYAETAMGNMKRTGIPASITLAQGCLESDNGNSRLARKANNHFGIKCHDWIGKRIYHNDDKRNECFRKYETVKQSFDDHSLFLTTKSRYAFLFELKPDDYKAWARGLKKAGYATNSKYASLLIRIIEDNELFNYDQLVLAGDYIPAEGAEGLSETSAREPLLNNRVEYVIVQEGDTPASLREEFDLYPFELYRYNKIKRGEALEPGMILYLQPKRFRAARGNETHIVRDNETMWDISQEYAVKLNRLYKRNNIEEGERVEPGTKIWLRKKRPNDQSLEPVFEEEKDDEQELEFKFEGI